MSRTLITYIIIFILCLASTTWSKEDSSYFPTPVPVNIAPGNYDNSQWGVGYNILNLTSDWEDNFFTFESEHVGDIEYQVQHAVLAFLKVNGKALRLNTIFLSGRLHPKKDPVNTTPI
jgi:hypothetical protein